jgi:serine protease
MLFNRLRTWFPGALLVVGLLVPPCTSVAAPSPAASASAPVVQRFLVKLRSNSEADGFEPAAARINDIATRHGLLVRNVRHIVSGIHVLQIESRSAAESAAQALARLRADPAVEYAELDQWRHAKAQPDDPLFTDQWFLQAGEPAAIDAVDAWNVTSGSPGLVIADLDTGVRFDHPDLRNETANRLLPGYNLISSAAIANNTYGRGPDASDPGDWISASDLKNPVFASCTVANSSWHGTRVAGVLGAITNNSTGVAGVTWQGWVEPVRVLGKCGGYDSDIIAGMAWAAGNPVEGVPDNPYPARILNMSLGAVGACPDSYQQMVDEVVAEGVLVVVSAGNEGGPVDAPANCAGVLAVAGLRHVGTKVGYSSLGPQIGIAAPAGNCVNSQAGEPCLYSIITTTNSGTTVPATDTYTDQYNYNVGTSFSAPQVAAIAGLMLSVNGNLTGEQLIERLQAGSQPFPVSSDPTVPMCHVPAGPDDIQAIECSCTTQTCGAGMVDANSAVIQALRPIAAVSVPAQFASGSTVALNASGSGAACNATIASYQWTVAQPATHPPVIHNAASAVASITAPPAGTTYVLMLTVTDNLGRSDSAQISVASNNAGSTAPAAAGGSACLAAVSYTVGSTVDSAGGTSTTAGSGGGGGTIDLLTLAWLAGGAAARVGQCYSRRSAASSHARCARR